MQAAVAETLVVNSMAGPRSHVLRCSNDFSSDFVPVNAIVQLFVHKSYYCDVVASHEVQAMADLRAWFWVVCRPDNALNGVIQDNVGDLIA